MRNFALVLLLIAFGAEAQGVAQTGALRSRQYRTFANLNLFVDAASGSDSTACTATGVGACATIQGALAKMPRRLCNRGTISVAAGSYTGFVVSGFTQDQCDQNTQGGLLIQGTLANITPTTGSATGTATSGTAGSGSTFGTLTDSTQSWTVNDLVGNFVVITAGTGSGQTFVISSNTATVITVVGTWTAPGGTSTYSIQQPSTIVSTGIPPVPRADQTTSGTTVGLAFVGNNFRDLGGLEIQNFRIALGAATGVYVYGGSAPRIDQTQLVFSSSSGSPFIHSGSGMLYANKVYSQLPAQTAGSQNGTHMANSIAALAEGPKMFMGSSLFVNGQWAMTPVNTSGVVSNSESRQIDRGFEFLRSSGQISNTRIGCAGATGQWGVAVGERHDGATSSAGVAVTSVNFSNCSYAFEQGGGNLYVLGATGLTGGAVFNLRGGGKVTINGATATGMRGSDGGTVDIQIDSYSGVAATTALFTDLLGVGDGGTVGSCIGTIAGASSICTQP